MEDDFTYVIRKALKGLSLAPGEAATRSNLPETEVMALLRGRFSASAARLLAPTLGLHPHALSSLPSYTPRIQTIDYIKRFHLPFESETVNAWKIEHQGIRLLFDAGFRNEDLAPFLTSTNLEAVFVTHQDRDHIGGLQLAQQHTKQTFVPAIQPLPDTLPLTPDQTLQFGHLKIQTIDLTGHFNGALGYLIHGLPLPVCVVGDGLFAGSIGGCPPERYQIALENLRRHVMTLPDSCILLPGHGPATTVGEEKVANPFLATVG